MLRVAVIILGLGLLACQDSGITGNKSNYDGPLFTSVSPAETGIHFNNSLTETATFNYLLYDGIFQGAGVGIIDYDNDGLQDIYFAGNQVPDKLYRNKGSLQFEDVTARAGIKADGNWSTGVAVADINNDGFQDLYICRFILDDPKRLKNLLYVNQGDGTFKEEAERWGIAGNDYSIHSNFFDLDKDGDLDLYVGNQPPNSTLKKQEMRGKIYSNYTDRLYRNDGNTFTEITGPAGITNYNYTLSVSTFDMNRDGWIDIYVACDFEEPDMFYQNNGDGTFTNIANEAIRHMSNFSMGADIADINNDGLQDIFVADMVANDNYRQKVNMSGMNPKKFWGLANAGYHYQYMFNALQLNLGVGRYSEIAQLAGVANTDWSWTALFADVDNDGWKDLMVTNGQMRDMRNKDFLNNAKKAGIAMKQSGKTDYMHIVQMAPSKKLNNFIYRNTGDLEFEDKIEDWGFDLPSWSNGAAYADLDKDGDLDYVISNMQDKAFVLENHCSEMPDNHYLRVAFTDGAEAFGATATIYYGDELQFHELSPMRGYMSSTEPVLHFGLGAIEKIDRVEIKWLNGKSLTMEDVKVNRVISVSHAQGSVSANRSPHAADTPIRNISNQSGIDHTHVENEFDDYAREILLPYKLSHLGPCVVAGDLTGDNLDDVFVGGAAGAAGVLYTQNGNGSFTKMNSATLDRTANYEDTGAEMFDADGDGDLDLYVVSGGNDFDEGSENYQDRLYLNDGKGNLSYARNALPAMPVSGSVARAADYDQDGDLDLFVGGRQVPGRYGISTRSYILQNNGGKFSDYSSQVADYMSETFGMVTDATWFDFDEDGDQDLVVAGEWMPITWLRNDAGSLIDVTAEMGFENSQGWWNCLTVSDLDGDDDLDLVAGNLGHNIKYKASEEEPFKVYVNDFDQNGSHDVYLGYYDADGVCYPVRGRQCSSEQMPFVAEKYATYSDFAVASIDDVLAGTQEGTIQKEARTFANSVIENKDGSFVMHSLPNHAQIAPINFAITHDCNGDGLKDLVVAGNFLDREVETTRSDAGFGQVLLSNGDMTFNAIPPVHMGLFAAGDARDAVHVTAGGKNLLIVANNNEPVEVYDMGRYSGPGSTLQ